MEDVVVVTKDDKGKVKLHQAVNLELRIWINDPKNGFGNLKDAVLLAVWISVRYPQNSKIFIALANPQKYDSTETIDYAS